MLVRSRALPSIDSPYKVEPYVVIGGADTVELIPNAEKLQDELPPVPGVLPGAPPPPTVILTLLFNTTLLL